LSKQKKSVIENKRSATPERQSNENASRKITYEPTSPPKNHKKRKKNKSNGGFKKFFKTIIIIILILAVTSFAVNALFFGNVNNDLQGNLSSYGISNEAAVMAKQHRIVNIAVFGVDGRDDVKGNRTDTIMIASADYEHSKIKVTSLMRDTYVYVNEKYGYDKINAAYAFGGPTLALQTINQNFDTSITDYVTIDFTAMVSMVNAVKGITIDIKSTDELYWVNQYLNDVNDKVNTSSPQLENLGPQLVDGPQALAYCRVRYVGDGDFDRTLRQRAVFEQVLSKALDLNLIDQYKLLMGTLPYVKTSLSIFEIIKYTANLALMPSKAIEQNRLPTDDSNALANISGVSYVIPDTLVDNIKSLYSFIYESDYTPSATASKISKKISATLSKVTN